MNFDLSSPLVTEGALFLLAVFVLMLGMAGGDSAADAGSRRWQRIGWVTFIGLLAVFSLTFGAAEGGSLFGGSFVDDGLAIFSKRLFVGAAALSVLGSLTLRQRPFERRPAE